MKTVTIAQAWQTYLEVEEAQAPAQHPAKTAECPTLKEWADHVIKKLPLRIQQYAHALRCHYCQVTLRQLRLLYNRPALELDEPTRERLSRWQAAAASSPGPRNRFLPAVLATDNEKSALVELTHDPSLLADGHLSLTINVVQPKFTRKELPVQLRLVVWPEGTVLDTFELPDLRAQQVTVKLPGDLLEQERWQTIKQTWPTIKTEELPLRCVLEAGCVGLAEVAEAARSRWTLAKEFRWVLKDTQRVAQVFYRSQSPQPSESSVQWWESLLMLLSPALVGTTSPQVPAVVRDAAGNTSDASVILAHGPFLSDRGELVMRITVDGLKADPHQTPVKLQLGFCPRDGISIFLNETIELRGLVNQLVKTDLPQAVLEQEWFPEPVTGQPLRDLPLYFILHVAEERDANKDSIRTLEARAPKFPSVEAPSGAAPASRRPRYVERSRNRGLFRALQ